MNTPPQPIDDGGPAFPSGESFHVKDVITGLSTKHSKGAFYDGMSLRDWFAGQALAGLLASLTEEEQGQEKPLSVWSKRLALASYSYADAMIAARHAVTATK
jgi:hypothetical protein